MDHGSYLDTYYRRPLEERRKDYLKYIRNLTILEAELSDDPEAIVLESVKAVAEVASIDTNSGKTDLRG